MTVTVTTPDDLSIEVVRRFAAPPRAVFAAHTVPELVQTWLTGPYGWSMPECEIDLRVGRGYRYVWRDAATGKSFGSHGEFLAVDTPHLIAFTERMDGQDGEMRCTTRCEVDGSGTRLIVTMRFADTATRDAALASGMAAGMGVSYDRLEAGFVPA